MLKQRRCLGCRTSDVKHSLYRFVAKDGILTWDKSHLEPGRGGYVHKRSGCLAKAVDLSRWERALKVKLAAGGSKLCLDRVMRENL